MPAKRCPRPCAKKAGGKPVKKGHTKDKGTFNFFPDPKRGKGRSVLKRPARAKTTQWKKVPYVRSKEAVQQQRMDRTSWKRKLADLLQATDVQLVRLLREDQLLQDWTGKTCPRCGKGRLSKAQLLLGASMPRHRCNRKGCQAYINPHHLHPIFKDATGASATPLQTQSALLFLLLNRIPHPAIHRILHINHKAIEDMENRLSHLRKRWSRRRRNPSSSATPRPGLMWKQMRPHSATQTCKKWPRTPRSRSFWSNGAASCNEVLHIRWS